MLCSGSLALVHSWLARAMVSLLQVVSVDKSVQPWSYGVQLGLSGTIRETEATRLAPRTASPTAGRPTVLLQPAAAAVSQNQAHTDADDDFGDFAEAEAAVPQMSQPAPHKQSLPYQKQQWSQPAAAALAGVWSSVKRDCLYQMFSRQHDAGGWFMPPSV